MVGYCNSKTEKAMADSVGMFSFAIGQSMTVIVRSCFKGIGHSPAHSSFASYLYV